MKKREKKIKNLNFVFGLEQLVEVVNAKKIGIVQNACS